MEFAFTQLNVWNNRAQDISGHLNSNHILVNRNEQEVQTNQHQSANTPTTHLRHSPSNQSTQPSNQSNQISQLNQLSDSITQHKSLNNTRRHVSTAASLPAYPCFHRVEMHPISSIQPNWITDSTDLKWWRMRGHLWTSHFSASTAHQDLSSPNLLAILDQHVSSYSSH